MGVSPFNYTINPGEDWIELSSRSGQVVNEERIWVSVNWELAPPGKFSVPLTISGPGESRVTVHVLVDHYNVENIQSPKGFIENNGCLSIEATHYQKAVENEFMSWMIIPNLGRTHSAITLSPVTARQVQPNNESPHLEYEVYLKIPGKVKVHACLSPTLNFHNTDGLKYGVSFDDGPDKIINMHEKSDLATWGIG